jgi:UDP-N-acetylmuramoyl-L-alanyl-D-glutamate--2,6-diaminopimelate ligase
LKLKDLVKGAPGVRFSPPELELEVSGLSDDSRHVKQGDLFGSLPSTGGKNPERARYEAQALAHGAVAVLKASEPRLAWARIAANFYGRPADKLQVAGVTGTNGKTTTAYLLRSIFEAADKKCALLGTVGYFIGKKRVEAPNTTPGALELTLLFKEAVDAKMDALVMEVSSHALDQYRVEGMAYDAAIFTNLTQDHLDYHKSMDAYLRAKMRLFGLLKTGGAAVINADDPAGKLVAKARKPGSRLIGFSAAGKKTELTASEIKFSARETKFVLNWEGKGHALRLPLPGRFNVSNALAAAGAALAMGIPMASVLKALKEPQLPPGRFELVDAGQDFQVVVDYAHTPDALERVLKTVREITDGRVIAVFGCGGDRDKSKRPKMGAIAAKLADLCIVTSDNPRSEDPESILDEIFAGMPKKAGEIQTALRLADRRKAIERAVKIAKPGDTVVLAGKGHEDYQVLAKGKVHFSDQESAKAAIKALRAKKA